MQIKNWRPIFLHEPDDKGGGSGGGTTPPPAPPPNANGAGEEKKFSQDELDSIVGERAKRASEGAVKKLLESLGVGSADDLKTALESLKKIEDARMGLAVIDIVGDDAVAHIAGAVLGDGKNGDFVHDDTVFITHGAERGESRQVYKKVLKNGAKGIFQGADVAADRAVGDVQFPGRLADAAQAGGGFEGTEGIQ